VIWSANCRDKLHHRFNILRNGYTAEFHDGYNDLVYLRARHYAPSTGRFLSRDTWGGDSNRPMSYNRWMYAYGNPIVLSDPTGMFPGEPGYCLPMIGKDRLQCEKLVRGLNPYNSMTLAEVILNDFYPTLTDCEPLYKVLNIPGNQGDKSESYGLWFHYLLNEKSERSNQGVAISISTVLSYALSAELAVGPTLSDQIMGYAINAMVHNGWMQGFYKAIGSRQAVRKEVDKFLFFPCIRDQDKDDPECKHLSPRIRERNWDGRNVWKNELVKLGDSVSGEQMLADYVTGGRIFNPSTALVTALQKALWTDADLRYKNGDIPYDWGNPTNYTKNNKTELWNKLIAQPWDSGEHKGEREVFYRTDPTGYYQLRDSDMYNIFFVLTETQFGNLCGGSCVAP